MFWPLPYQRRPLLEEICADIARLRCSVASRLARFSLRLRFVQYVFLANGVNAYDDQQFSQMVTDLDQECHEELLPGKERKRQRQCIDGNRRQRLQDSQRILMQSRSGAPQQGLAE